MKFLSKVDDDPFFLIFLLGLVFSPSLAASPFLPGACRLLFEVRKRRASSSVRCEREPLARALRGTGQCVKKRECLPSIVLDNFFRPAAGLAISLDGQLTRWEALGSFRCS